MPIPAGVLTGADGPTVLLTAGVHGDEFEGPVALLKLMRSLDVDALRGRIIVLPRPQRARTRETHHGSRLWMGET